MSKCEAIRFMANFVWFAMFVMLPICAFPEPPAKPAHGLAFVAALTALSLWLFLPQFLAAIE